MFHSNAAAHARRTPLLAALAALAMIAVTLTASSADAAASKTLVCHVEGNGTAHVVAVSDQAVDAHVAHGDAMATTGVAGDECSPNAAPVASNWYLGHLGWSGSFNLNVAVTDDGPGPYSFYIVPGSTTPGLIVEFGTTGSSYEGWFLYNGAYGSFDWYVCDGLDACSNTARFTFGNW